MPLFRALGVWHRLEYARRLELDENFNGRLPDDALADMRAGIEAAAASGEMEIKAPFEGEHAIVLPSTWDEPGLFARAIVADKKSVPPTVPLRVNRGLRETEPEAGAQSYDDLAAYSQSDVGSRAFNKAAHGAGMFHDKDGESIEAVPLVSDHAAEAAYWHWRTHSLPVVLHASANNGGTRNDELTDEGGPPRSHDFLATMAAIKLTTWTGDSDNEFFRSLKKDYTAKTGQQVSFKTVERKIRPLWDCWRKHGNLRDFAPASSLKVS